MSLPESLRRPIDVLMIDNFDSFTWNLYQSLSLLGINVTVIRNDAIDASALPFLDIKRLIISPGPGHPQTDSGVSRDAVRFFTGKVPILGVCMGLEVVVDVFGGEIAYAGEIKHGKLSPIRHDGRGIFSGLPQSFQSTRYHSLSASVKTVPDVLAITAATEESGVIMGVRHRQFTIEAVQYHPESVLSEQGDTLLQNFLNLRGGTWDDNPVARVSDLSLPPFPIEAPSTSTSSASSTSPKTNKLPTILEKIHIQRLKDIEVAKNTPGTSMEDLETLLAMNLAPAPIDLVARMKTTPNTAPALMAEIKRASPSKGAIAPHANAAQQALTYALAGASVVSVLTEPHWFKGSLLDMRLTRQALDALPNRPAVLRKDFIVDEYQIAEARLHGADTVLLIVALLPIPRLRALYAYAKRLGMEPLVEVNNAQEMDAALALGARVVGVNNRNLHTFDVDMGTTTRLVRMVRERDVILCALSGISGHEDVRKYVEQGVGAVLVGEALMRAEDTTKFIRELLGWDISDEEEDPLDGQPPLVKICGIRTVDEALTAAQAGADMLGLVFVPSSKRRIALDVACRISHAIRERRTQAESEVPLSSLPSVVHDAVDTPQIQTSTSSKEEAQAKNTPWFLTNAFRLSSTLRAGHARPQLVGVFQDQPLSYILEVIAAAQLDIVQFHGTEPAHWASHVPVPVIRAFHIVSGSSASTNSSRSSHGNKSVEAIARPGLHKFVLLDAVREDGLGLSGGSGKIVDWEFARRVVDGGEVGPSGFFERFSLSPSPASSLSVQTNGHTNGNGTGLSPSSPSRSRSRSRSPSPSPSFQNQKEKPDVETSSAPRLPLILAGGLTPLNVRAAIARVRPWAVDVSGGVERPDGTGKDLERVVAFIRAVKGDVSEPASRNSLFVPRSGAGTPGGTMPAVAIAGATMNANTTEHANGNGNGERTPVRVRHPHPEPLDPPPATSSSATSGTTDRSTTSTSTGASIATSSGSASVRSN